MSRSCIGVGRASLAPNAGWPCRYAIMSPRVPGGIWTSTGFPRRSLQGGGFHMNYREFLNPPSQQLDRFIHGLCETLHVDFETLPHGRLFEQRAELISMP